MPERFPIRGEINSEWFEKYKKFILHDSEKGDFEAELVGCKKDFLFIKVGENFFHCLLRNIIQL
ncbi:MAG: hypothetical protein ABIJ23_04035 [Candidatus Magasanikbacteria bacterium]